MAWVISVVFQDTQIWYHDAIRAIGNEVVDATG